jgi:hypothetical protein
MHRWRDRSWELENELAASKEQCKWEQKRCKTLMLKQKLMEKIAHDAQLHSANERGLMYVDACGQS